MFVFRVILVRIFPHSDWIQRDADNFYAVQRSDKIKCDFIKKETLVTFKITKLMIFITFVKRPVWQ